MNRFLFQLLLSIATLLIASHGKGYPYGRGYNRDWGSCGSSVAGGRCSSSYPSAVWRDGHRRSRRHGRGEHDQPRASRWGTSPSSPSYGASASSSSSSYSCRPVYDSDSDEYHARRYSTTSRRRSFGESLATIIDDLLTIPEYLDEVFGNGDDDENDDGDTAGDSDDDDDVKLTKPSRITKTKSAASSSSSASTSATGNTGNGRGPYGNKRSNRSTSARPEVRSLTPKFDIQEDEKTVNITMEVPGVTTKNLDVEVENERKVRVSGSRLALGSESSLLKFNQVFEFDTIVDVEKIEVTLEDGLLRLTIPKRSRFTKKVSIPIKETEEGGK